MGARVTVGTIMGSHSRPREFPREPVGTRRIPRVIPPVPAGNHDMPRAPTASSVCTGEIPR